MNATHEQINEALAKVGRQGWYLFSVLRGQRDVSVTIYDAKGRAFNGRASIGRSYSAGRRAALARAAFAALCQPEVSRAE